MHLAKAHVQLLTGQAAGGFVLNAVLNGALAWLLFPPVAALPLWARGTCIGGDTIGTSFFLPLITCLILTALERRALRAGAMPAIPRASLPKSIRWLPANVVGRGALVGLGCALTIALLTLFALGAAGVVEMSRAQDTVYKTLYTAILGAAVSPLFGLRALADVPVKAIQGST